MVFLNSPIFQSLQDVNSTLWICNLKACDIVQSLAGLFLSSQQMCSDFSSIFKIKSLLIAIIEDILNCLNSCCIFVWDYVNNPLKDIFRRLLFLFLNRRRRNFFHFFWIFLLLWIFNHFFLRRWWFDESTNRKGHIEAYYKDSITVKVVIRCDNFLHFVAGSCVEIDVFGLEILESVAGNDWDFVPCASHRRFEKLNKRAGGNSIIV